MKKRNKWIPSLGVEVMNRNIFLKENFPKDKEGIKSLGQFFAEWKKNDPKSFNNFLKILTVRKTKNRAVGE